VRRVVRKVGQRSTRRRAPCKYESSAALLKTGGLLLPTEQTPKLGRVNNISFHRLVIYSKEETN
jgi:hypothetical protein